MPKSKHLHEVGHTAVHFLQRTLAVLASMLCAQRILGVEYQIPEDVQLSQDLENLLRRMLAADPCRRISVAEILATPWFREGLPPGVIEMNAQMPAGANPDKGQVSKPAS